MFRPVMSRVQPQLLNMGRRMAIAIPGVSASNTPWLLAAGAGCVGIGALVGRGLLATSPASAYDSRGLSASAAQGSLPEYMRSRLKATYGHIAAGLGLTAVSATAFWRSGYANFARTNPWLFMGGTFLTTIVSMFMCRSIPYENTAAKHATWAIMMGAMGLSLCPMAAMGGTLLLRAAAATGAVVGSLSLVAATTPNRDEFLSLSGPLSVGLGVVVAASLGNMFFPAIPFLYNIGLYGGLGVFGLFTCYDTQKVMIEAENAPEGAYDPINTSFGLYLDTINMFVRIATIMGNNKRK